MLKERVSEVKEFIAALHRVADRGSALDPTIVSTMLKRHIAAAGYLQSVSALDPPPGIVVLSNSGA